MGRKPKTVISREELELNAHELKNMVQSRDSQIRQLERKIEELVNERPTRQEYDRLLTIIENLSKGFANRTNPRFFS